LKEIERQFLCRSVALEVLAGADRSLSIQQGYLTEGDPAVRVRLRDGDWILTVKSGMGLVREEVEVPIDADAGRALMAMAGERRLEKTRHLIGPWELDVFHGKLDGLIVLELELESEHAPTPDFPAGIEVLTEATGRSEYRNQALAGLSPPAAARLVERLVRGQFAP
jgi:CYTH domain-containing protein